MSEPLLTIEDLHVAAEGHEILRGIDLVLRAGDVHAVMGPNGSGKSTLAHVLAGREGFEVTRGRVLYQGRDLLGMPPEERARGGLFLGFQYPVEIPGVSNLYFLRSAVNAVRKARGEEEYDAVDFLRVARETMKLVDLDETLAKRSVNDGFSGGEKKRNEIFQMLVLEPRLAILDETDSGLDVDAMRVISDGINSMRRADRAILLITHYHRLLHHVVPDRVHVLVGGVVVHSGAKELATTIEEKGYAEWSRAEGAPAP